MTEPIISKRLNSILNVIPHCETFADVGTDHALLPIMAVKNGVCEKAILTDVRKGPLETAKKNIMIYLPEYSGKFDLRLCDGLEKINPFEADVIAICGMGGNLIAHILETNRSASENCKKLILQPNTCVDALRKYLNDKGIKIDNEQYIVDENHPYVIIEAHYTGEKTEYSEQDLFLGKFLSETAEDEYLELIFGKMRHISEASRGSEGNARSDFYNELSKRVGELIESRKNN